MALGEFVFTLFVLALVVLGLYLFYGYLHRTFQRVGFTPGEAGAILLGTLIGSAWNIPIWPEPINGWILAVNVGGAVVPVLVSFVLLRRLPGMGIQATVGVTVVALATYLVTSVRQEGIVAPLHLAMIPPIVAAAIALTSYWREEEFSAPLAYVSGSLGALIGADFLRISEFLAQAPPEPGAMASMGGAAVFDMVFLTGVLAVTLDTLVFRRFQREKHVAPLPYEQAEVFTVSTTPERMSRWDLTGLGGKTLTVHGEEVRGLQAARARPQTAERPPPRPAQPRPTADARRAERPPSWQPAAPRVEPQPSQAESERLARHRAWEEQMKRQRGG